MLTTGVIILQLHTSEVSSDNQNDVFAILRQLLNRVYAFLRNQGNEDTRTHAEAALKQVLKHGRNSVKSALTDSVCNSNKDCKIGNDFIQPDNFNQHFDEEKTKFLFNVKCLSHKLTAAIVIFSVGGNVQRRTAIRETWANGTQMALLHAIAVFLVGNNSTESDSTLMQENERYGDIVHVDIAEDYYNLTLKTIVALKWAIKYCGSALFLMKTDDDSFVNVPLLVEELRSKDSRSDLLFGHRMQPGRPNRAKGSKFYLPYWMYKHEKTPAFLSGSGYVMSMTAARKLYAEAARTPMVWFEDVFITGICAEEAAIPRVHSALFNITDKRARTKFGNVSRKLVTKAVCLFRKSALIHRVAREELLFIWNKLADKSYLC